MHGGRTCERHNYSDMTSNMASGPRRRHFVPVVNALWRCEPAHILGGRPGDPTSERASHHRIL